MFLSIWKPINFRPIDKDRPFKFIPNKNILHRLSASVGWTLTSLKEEGKRTDFFSSSSLLLGLGFRLNNTFRITTGTLLFKQEDQNPLVDDQTIGSVAFAGISIDLEISELTKGFKDLF